MVRQASPTAGRVRAQQMPSCICMYVGQGQRFICTDVKFAAQEDGETIDPADWGWEPDDEDVFRQLAVMGYTEEEIHSVLQ